MNYKAVHKAMLKIAKKGGETNIILAKDRLISTKVYITKSDGEKFFILSNCRYLDGAWCAKYGRPYNCSWAIKTEDEYEVSHGNIVGIGNIIII